jgi:hypothetical protein
MLAVLHPLGMFIVDLFKWPRRLEAGNLLLRDQLSIALRRAPPRLRLRGCDRALLVWMTRLWPSLLGATEVGSAGDHSAVASLGLQGVLALDVPE